ncbi:MULTISPECIES: hypothetical protein [unclassified Microcoleus]|uniref:hypothetical protein n=1 Tax=unclassified Microcoleus TaxID=2642155 RepID=UPI002FCF79B1
MNTQPQFEPQSQRQLGEDQDYDYIDENGKNQKFTAEEIASFEEENKAFVRSPSADDFFLN